MVVYQVTFENLILKVVTLYMRDKINICTAGPAYAVDRTIYPFSVVKVKLCLK